MRAEQAARRHWGVGVLRGARSAADECGRGTAAVRRARRARWARRQLAAGAGSGAHGVGPRGARPGRACARRLGVLAGQLGQVGALCTWLSFDSVFDRFDSVLFLSHEMNTVHLKFFFGKKYILN